VNGVRPSRLLLPLLVAGLAVAGCAQLQDDSDDERRSDAEAARLQTELSGLPGVAAAQVRYVLDGSTPGNVLVSLQVEPAASPQVLVDSATKAVWTSRISPLSAIKLDAGDLRTTVLVRRQQAELDRRFGPRPSTTDG
jgi:hypothetical protein